jgi:hypothetical protein
MSNSQYEGGRATGGGERPKAALVANIVVPNSTPITWASHLFSLETTQ